MTSAVGVEGPGVAESGLAAQPKPPPPQLWRPGPLSQGDLVITTFMVLMIVATFVFEPSVGSNSLFGYELPTTCLWRGLTGWRCPGCGLTRAFVFMGHFQPIDAFRVHVLGPPLYLVAVAYTVSRLVQLTRAIRQILAARR